MLHFFLMANTPNQHLLFIPGYWSWRCHLFAILAYYRRLSSYIVGIQSSGVSFWECGLSPSIWDRLLVGSHAIDGGDASQEILPVVKAQMTNFQSHALMSVMWLGPCWRNEALRVIGTDQFKEMRVLKFLCKAVFEVYLVGLCLFAGHYLK